MHGKQRDLTDQVDKTVIDEEKMSMSPSRSVDYMTESLQQARNTQIYLCATIEKGRWYRKRRYATICLPQGARKTEVERQQPPETIYHEVATTQHRVYRSASRNDVTGIPFLQRN